MKKSHIETHFNDLKDLLDATEESYRKFFIIHSFDYLINYLGCLVLSLMNEDSLKQLRNTKELYRLTAGEWIEVIEYSLKSGIFSDHLRQLIIGKFLMGDESLQLHYNYKRWHKLRNTVAHSIVIPNRDIIDKELLKHGFISIEDTFENFIKDLEDVSIRYIENISESQFFNYINDAIYIYARIKDDGKVEYRHFSKLPVEKERPSNFPIRFKEIFLSLEETPNDFLLGFDKIKVRIKTAFSKPYENDFQLYINDNFVMDLKNKRYYNGDIIEFDISDVSNIPEGDVRLAVKALRSGNLQGNQEKYIKIYKQQPAPEIYWSNRSKNILIPIGKEKNIDFMINSKFPISISSVTIKSEDQQLRVNAAKYDDINNYIFKGEIPIHSTEPCVENISVIIDYNDAFGKQCNFNTSLTISFEPDFFEPEFVGEDRQSILRQMTGTWQNYLILGEGGIGKSRLIREYIRYGEAVKLYEIKAGGQTITDKLAKAFNIDKNIEGLLDLLSNISSSTLLWFQDCHEYTDRKDIEFLKRIMKLTEENQNLSVILESRDESWGPAARNFINELAQTNVVIHRLNRLNRQDLIKIIDNVFYMNDFPKDKKLIIADKCDGIVYIMLEILKILSRRGQIIYIKTDPVYRWRFTETESFEGIMDEFNKFNINRIMSIDIDRALSDLHQKGFRKKAIELMRYLCIDEISAKDLAKLLELLPIETTEILEHLKSYYIITEVRKKDIPFYTFHHQIKRDFFAKEHFPDELFCHYYFMVGIVTSSEESPSRNVEDISAILGLDQDQNQNQENIDSYEIVNNKGAECLNDLQIEPPFIYEKLKYMLVYHAYLCVNNVEKILHIMEKNKKFLSNSEFSLLLYNLSIRYIGITAIYPPPYPYPTDIDNNLITKLRGPLISIKNLLSNEESEDINLYYLIEYCIEEELFILDLYEKAIEGGFSGYDKEEEEFEFEETNCRYWYLFQTFFCLAKYLPVNDNFLKYLNARVELLCEYAELTKDINEVNYNFEDFDFMLSPDCKDCKAGFLPILFHVKALLYLFGLEDKDKYLHYINEFFNKCKINSRKENILFAHLISIKKAGLNMHSIIEILPSNIKKLVLP